jgi:adenine specific DNA methylase Mod
MGNELYYGDNLQVLRDHIGDESVDLIYLDPPLNSNGGYNVLFKGPKGGDSPAQIEAFDDTWHWSDMVSGQALLEVKQSPYQDAAAMLDAMVGFLGKNAMTAYLCMMGIRLTELHRVLKPTGSLYLHCDPTASHYLKILLDAVFGARNFINEVIWKRTGHHGGAKNGGLSMIQFFIIPNLKNGFGIIHRRHTTHSTLKESLKMRMPEVCFKT